MQMEKIEKRVETRVEYEESAKYKILGEGDESIAYRYEKAQTKNISKGGVCMSVPHKITPGNVIRVEIPMEANSHSIKAFCEVQWCRKDDSNNTFEAGLSFIALKEDDVEILEKYVKNNPQDRLL